MQHNTFQTFKLKPLMIALCLSPGLVVANQLDNIVVTAQNVEQSQRSVTGNMTVITRQDIERGQYQTFSDALKTVPGVFIKNNGGIGQQTSIFMRGASSSSGHILILIDGIEQTDPSGFGADIANLQLDNIERIEILKGPQSGVWGANASAGVINIITRQGGQQASAFIEVGSYNSKTMSANLGAGNEQVDFVVNILNQSTDGYSAVRKYKKSHDRYEADAFNNKAMSFKLGVNLNEQHRIETYVKSTSSYNEFDDGTNPNQTANNNTYDSQVKSVQYRFKNQTFNSRLFLTEQAINRESNSPPSIFEGNITEFGFIGGLDYGFNNALTVSASQKEYTSKPDKYTNKGISLSNRNQIGDNLFIDEAIRFDQYNKFKDAVTGRIGIKNYFNTHTYLAANYATGYNAPSIFQATNPNNPKELKPESVEGYEVTLASFGGSLTYFSRTTQDLLKDQGTWPNGYYINQTGETKESGIEFDYQRELPIIHSQLSFNYTWLEAKNKDGKFLNYRPEQQANINFDYSGFNKTLIGIETRYMGKQYSTNDRKGAQIGDYVVVDLKASYTVSKHFDIQAKVVNLFNDEYTTGVTDYPATNPTPDYVYSNGGTQLFIRLTGKL